MPTLSLTHIFTPLHCLQKKNNTCHTSHSSHYQTTPTNHYTFIGHHDCTTHTTYHTHSHTHFVCVLQFHNTNIIKHNTHTFMHSLYNHSNTLSCFECATFTLTTHHTDTITNTNTCVPPQEQPHCVHSQHIYTHNHLYYDQQHTIIPLYIVTLLHNIITMHTPTSQYVLYSHILSATHDTHTFIHTHSLTIPT